MTTVVEEVRVPVRAEALWRVVGGLRFENGEAPAHRQPAAWWEAVTTNADTFQRIA